MLKRVIGPLLLLVSTLLLLEGVLRIVPSPVQYPSAHEQDDPDSLVGIELVPGAREVMRSPCHESVFTVNSEGWRDREHPRVPGDKRVRIAVLGDSYMAGAGVSDDEIFSRQLEQFLGPADVEVFNFGLTSIGTVQEDILYEHVVSQYKPDIVLLGFYVNDVLNNDPVLEGGGLKRTRLAYRDGGGGIIYFREPPGAFFSLRRSLRTRSALFRLVKAAHATVRSLLDRTAMSGTGSLAGYPRSYAVYGPPPDALWKHAWETTEQTILTLEARVEPSGYFFLFTVPDVLQVARDPQALIRQQFGVDPPATFDPLYPAHRLADFAKAKNLQTIDLPGAFQAYRDREHLPYPYFSYTCDGHWSAFGHRFAAQVVAERLKPLVSELVRQKSGTPS